MTVKQLLIALETLPSDAEVFDADDAALFANRFAPYLTATSLASLDAYEAVVSAHIGSTQLPPVNVTTPPPLPATGRPRVLVRRFWWA